MGSSYTVTEMSRVNVVRTARGFRRVSQEILGVTGSEHMTGFTEIIVSCILDMENEAYQPYFPDSGFDEAHETWIEYVLAVAKNCDVPIVSSFETTWYEFLAAVLAARADNRRVVISITTDIVQQCKLSRAVICDFTTTSRKELLK